MSMIKRLIGKVTASERFRIKGILAEDDVSPLERKARSSASYEWAEPHKARCIRERFVMYADKHDVSEASFCAAAKMVGVSPHMFTDAAYDRKVHNGEIHWISLIPGWVFADSKLDTYLVRQDEPRSSIEIMNDIRAQIQLLQDEYKRMPSLVNGHGNINKTILYDAVESEMGAFDSL